MQNQLSDTIPLIYRPYNLPVNFPVVAFLGDNWLVSMNEPKFLHFHNCIEIGFCVSGSGSVYLNNKIIHYNEGDYSIVLANEPHISVSEIVPSKWVYVYFEPHLLLKAFHKSHNAFCHVFSFSHNSPGIVSEKEQALLCRLLRQIFEEFYNKKALYQDSVNGLLLSVLSIVEQIPEQDKGANDELHPLCVIQDAFLYIQNHFTETITISELAGICKLSESHFRKLFRTITGYSPLECIQHYRIHQACHHIYMDQNSIHAIAGLVGYKTLSSFNRQFQQCMHMSPSEWKKACLDISNQNEVTSYDDENTRHIFQI